MSPGDLKSVQVRVAPAHGLLKELVDEAEREVARHPDAPPHTRFNIGERDLELIDRSSARRLRRPSSRLLRWRRYETNAIPRRPNRVIFSDRR
jgi:hypothetical protein